MLSSCGPDLEKSGLRGRKVSIWGALCGGNGGGCTAEGSVEMAQIASVALGHGRDVVQAGIPVENHAVTKISWRWKLAIRLQLWEELKAWKETGWDCGKKLGLRKGLCVKGEETPLNPLHLPEMSWWLPTLHDSSVTGTREVASPSVGLDLYSDWSCLYSWNELNYLDEKLAIKHHSFCTRWPRTWIPADTAVLLQPSLGTSSTVVDNFSPD